MTRITIIAICVLVTAAPVRAEPTQSDTVKVAAVDIAGRWKGPHYRMASSDTDCEGERCTLTLDISRCGEGWCGVLVSANQTCGGNALTIAAGEPGDYATLFKGRLELAKGTEPYLVQAYHIPASENDAERIDIEGDTGGEFRAFRRSFPFSAQLARAGEVHCHPEKPVS